MLHHSSRMAQHKLCAFLWLVGLRSVLIDCKVDGVLMQGFERGCIRRQEAADATKFAS